MKMLLGLLLMLPAASSAATPGNPDHVPSLGISHSWNNTQGTLARFNAPDGAPYSATESHSKLTFLDFRLPMNRWATLTAGYGWLTTDSRSEGVPMLFNQNNQDARGHSYSVGLRLYLQK